MYLQIIKNNKQNKIFFIYIFEVFFIIIFGSVYWTLWLKREKERGTVQLSAFFLSSLSRFLANTSMSISHSSPIFILSISIYSYFSQSYIYVIQKPHWFLFQPAIAVSLLHTYLTIPPNPAPFLFPLLSGKNSTQAALFHCFFARPNVLSLSRSSWFSCSVSTFCVVFQDQAVYVLLFCLLIYVGQL